MFEIPDKTSSKTYVFSNLPDADCIPVPSALTIQEAKLEDIKSSFLFEVKELIPDNLKEEDPETIYDSLEDEIDYPTCFNVGDVIYVRFITTDNEEKVIKVTIDALWGA